MKHVIVLLSTMLFLCASNTAKAQKKLVIIGSSTSTCYNVDPVTACYVERLNAYYNQELPFDSIIDNHLALSNTSVYNGMPTGYIPPYSAPAFQPFAGLNITYALSLRPDVILINYPNNYYDVLPVDSILYCLRTIRDTANSKGVPCFITTTQARTDPASYNTPEIKRKLALLKDSILAAFGIFAIDFWTGLINPADSSLLYDSGDHLHMNAAGHEILFQRVLAKNIFSTGTGSALPVTFLRLNAVYKNNTNIISWATIQETDVAFYEIQRSTDGVAFSKISIVNAASNTGNNQYHYTDDQPLKGWNYYKILIIDRDGKKHASPVIRVRTSNGKLAVLRVFANASAQVAIELQNSERQNVQLQLFNNMGMLLSKTAAMLAAGNSLIYINTPFLSKGVYHIRVTAARASAMSSFIKNQ